VVYAFLTVLESAINAVYWFRKWALLHFVIVKFAKSLTLPAFYYTFKFILVLWMALPQTSGAQVIFRSFIQPVFSRFFSQTGSTAADLRAKADSASKHM
jgi:receptor expression-enhancing protein 5/6